MRIDCPYCGPRDEREFRFGGEAHLARPALTVSDGDWAEYLFFRKNPRGIHYERWLHAHGCRRWFNVVRNTLTHRIEAVYPMGAAPPPNERATS